MTTAKQAAARIDAPPDPDKVRDTSFALMYEDKTPEKTRRAFLALAREYIDSVAEDGWICAYVARVYGDEALADFVLAMLADHGGRP